MSALKEKYKKKVEELDARMKELEAMEFTPEVEAEMYEVMGKTNRYLRAMGADSESLYDI